MPQTQAVLCCSPASQPFEERVLVLGADGAAVGRAAGKSRPGPDNGTFDCKVLSRYHARIWHRGEKFFLQDTRSSNGTYVNGRRLSKSGEESYPYEIFSGDVLQFGIDITENSHHVTYSCIIATARLYLPNGVEFKQRPRNCTSNEHQNKILLPSQMLYTQEIYQLSHYLQEALYREQLLEKKLCSLQNLLSSTREASDENWQALIVEDKLLSRLSSLENRLFVYSKTLSKEWALTELCELQKDKEQYESAAKLALSRAVEAKLKSEEALCELQCTLQRSETERERLSLLSVQSQNEVLELLGRHEAALSRIEELEENFTASRQQQIKVAEEGMQNQQNCTERYRENIQHEEEARDIGDDEEEEEDDDHEAERTSSGSHEHLGNFEGMDGNDDVARWNLDSCHRSPGTCASSHFDLTALLEGHASDTASTSTDHHTEETGWLKQLLTEVTMASRAYQARCTEVEGLLEDERAASNKQAEASARHIQRLHGQLKSLREELESLAVEKASELNEARRELEEARIEAKRLRLDLEEAALGREADIATLQEECGHARAELQRERSKKQAPVWNPSWNTSLHSKGSRETKLRLHGGPEEVRQVSASPGGNSQELDAERAQVAQRLQRLKQDLVRAQSASEVLHNELGGLRASRMALEEEVYQLRGQRDELQEVHRMIRDAEQAALANQVKCKAVQLELQEWQAQHQASEQESQQMRLELARCRRRHRRASLPEKKKPWAGWLPLMVMMVGIAVSVLYPTMD
uniref:sarcolemmal membrane-associated protein-like isoform X2 n=1 Tax=Myxine glutinosa TaxID=7769 RepID=UPI00358F1B7A